MIYWLEMASTGIMVVAKDNRRQTAIVDLKSVGGKHILNGYWITAGCLRKVQGVANLSGINVQCSTAMLFGVRCG